MIDSILNINISCFASVTSTTPVDINLLSWLTSDKHRAKVEQIRSLQDETLQKTIKATLPAITPSGRFSRRDSEHLIEHSGFLAFDIDEKDNRHISNFNQLRSQLKNITSVAYCGLSVRGRGFWGLVPVPKSTPAEHKQRFGALSKDLKYFGINIDQSGSDVCRLRIYSFDADAYFNHNAVVYSKILKPEPPKYSRAQYTDTRGRVETIIAKLKDNHTDITESYDNWLHVGCSLANEFGEGGRAYFHTASMFHPLYSPRTTDYLFDQCLKHDYRQISIATFFHIASQFGITAN